MYNYILVLADFGACFVTSMDRYYSYWEKDKEPMNYSTKKNAESYAYGLRLNGFKAFAISSKTKITRQPYRYDLGEFKWVKKEVENERNE